MPCSSPRYKQLSGQFGFLVFVRCVCINAFYLRKSGGNSMCPGLNLRCSSCNGMADIASLFVEIREFISCD